VAGPAGGRLTDPNRPLLAVSAAQVKTWVFSVVSRQASGASSGKERL
jgi:hypothetical protein